MRLASIGPGAELALILDDRAIPSSTLGADLPTTMAGLLADWEIGLDALRAATSGGVGSSGLALAETQLLAPVPRPGKILAAGVNYRSHGDEQNREPPDHPVLFAKMPTAVIGHGEPIRWSSRLTQGVDFEAELAIVIGRPCRRVDESEALDYVAGYTCLNDVSARDLQYSDKQFVRGKSLDTFCPIGPWLVTPHEVPDPQALRVRGLRNGTVMQDASTAEMIFSVAHLISFCSQAMTLEPGDVIATGTPAGVGWFREPKVLLGDGDEVMVDIEGVGRLVNTCHVEDE